VHKRNGKKNEKNKKRGVQRLKVGCTEQKSQPSPKNLISPTPLSSPNHPLPHSTTPSPGSRTRSALDAGDNGSHR